MLFMTKPNHEIHVSSAIIFVFLQRRGTPVKSFNCEESTMNQKYLNAKNTQTKHSTTQEAEDQHVQEDEKILWNFAMETTAHGVSKAASAKSAIKRAFWIIALVGAFALSAVMITLR